MVAGVRFELTTFGPESRGSCGTPKKKSARLTGSLAAAARRQGKRPDPGSGLLNQRMVAGVRFELTTFGLWSRGASGLLNTAPPRYRRRGAASALLHDRKHY